MTRSRQTLLLVTDEHCVFLTVKVSSVDSKSSSVLPIDRQSCRLVLLFGTSTGTRCESECQKSQDKICKTKTDCRAERFADLRFCRCVSSASADTCIRLIFSRWTRLIWAHQAWFHPKPTSTCMHYYAYWCIEYPRPQPAAALPISSCVICS